MTEHLESLIEKLEQEVSKEVSLVPVHSPSKVPYNKIAALFLVFAGLLYALQPEITTVQSTPFGPRTFSWIRLGMWSTIFSSIVITTAWCTRKFG